MIPNYDFLDEIRNFCIKIPLLQAIKEIPILAKNNKGVEYEKTRMKNKGDKKNTIGRKNSRYNDEKYCYSKIYRSQKSSCQNTYQWNLDTKHIN